MAGGSLSSYEELLKQVASLKAENSHLRRELHDNSSHLTKLEDEASNMKDVLSHLHTAIDDNVDDDVTNFAQESSFLDQSQTQDGHEGAAEELDHNSNSSLLNDSAIHQAEVMLGPRDPFMENNMRGEGFQNRPAGKAQSESAEASPGKRRLNGEREFYSNIQELDQERTAIVHDIESEDKLRKWYYEQLEIFTKKIETLPLTPTYNLQADMNRRQLEYEIQKLRESLQENLGSSESIATRHEARLHRIHMIEREMLHLQQQYHQNLSEFEEEGAKAELGACDRVQVETDAITRVEGATNTPTPGEAFITKSGVENNAYTSDRQIDLSPGGTRVISMATQTADVVIPDLSSLPDIPLPQNTNMSAIYHGAWSITKGTALADEGSLSGFVAQETSSLMSFNSSNSHGSSLQCSPSPPKKPTQQHLGTKYPCFVAPQVEMVYSLLSMLGTHDKDDMSRTLLAMSSSQDSCIAMRQSGCMPLLIQLLHGSDKDSGLLGNTRGSKAARARAAAALHNIVHSHPDDKRGRREARVLRLLEQIRAHCDQLRDIMEEESVEAKTAVKSSDIDHHPGPAIAALMKLSFDEEHRHAICTLGGLQAIAELLEVDHAIHGNTGEQYNITMRRYACMALTNLTFGDGTNKALLCSMKSCMEGLVAQLHSYNEDLCQVAASVLRNLSWRADLASKKTLREVGAVTTLMLAAMAVKKESTLKSILSALWNLSAHCSENKADICAVDNALVFLVNTLTYKSPSKTLAIIENGGGILRNVSSHVAIREDYRKVLRQHGCLQILLKHLRSPSLTIVSNACGTLWNLSARCPEDQQALWDMGAVSMLKNLLHSKHKMISMGSAAALKNLLAARPSMTTVSHMDKHKTNMPTLQARKQRALEAEIDQSLSETCENVDSPRDSPIETQTKKDDLEPKRFLFNGENFGVYQVTSEPEHRRPMIRGQFFPRSGSGDSSSLIDGRLRSPQRVARSGSQDSVGSVHSDISHDRSRVQNMLAKSSKLLHERQGGSLDRRKDANHSSPGYNSGSRSLDSAAEVYRLRNGSPANSRIMQVMKEVALNAGIDGEYNRGTPGSDKGQHRDPQNPAGQRDNRRIPVFNYQNNPVFKGLVPFDTGQQGLGDPPNRVLKYPPNNLRQSGQRIGEDPNNVDPAPDDGGEDQPINYSMNFEPENPEESTGHNMQLNSSMNNRPPPKIGNYVGSAFTPQQHRMSNMVRNNFPPPKNIQAQRNFCGEKPAGGNIKKFNSLPEKDFTSDDQPTDYSRLYAEHSDEAYNAEQPVNYSNHYQDCADCKLEEARRTNDILEQMMGDDDCVRTFYTEGTPLNYMSMATSLTDLSQHHKLAEANKSAMNQVPEDESQGYTTHFEKEDNEDSALSESVREVHMESIQERTVVEAESEPQSPSEKPNTYCEEGTPLCFSRVSSLSSLHSVDARDRQEVHMKYPGELQSIDEVDVSPRGNDSNQGNYDQKKTDLKVLKAAVKDANSPPGPSDSPEKEHKTVTWDDNHQVQETPLMYSRSSSLGSLSSFDAHSVHSSVMSDYSRRPSGNVSPSDLPDSPSETMPPTPRCKSPSRSTGTSASQGESESNGISSSEENKTDTVKVAEAEERRDAEKHNIEDGHSELELATEETTDDHLAEVPVTYATEDTPLNFSETTSLSGLSIHHLDNELEETLAAEDPETPKPAEWKTGLRVIDNRENDNNSSLSEVSEGEEDILAQCISSAMPNNSSRKMKKSASDHAIKKKVGFFKIENLNQTKSKLPTKMVNTTTAGPLSPPHHPPPVAKKTNLPPKPQPAPPVNEAEPDTMKSYATEGTPLNFSRSESLSDISVATSNISNIMDIAGRKSLEAQERTLMDDSKSDNSSFMEDQDDLLSDLIQSAMPKGKSPKKVESRDKTPFAFHKNNLKDNTTNNTSIASIQPRHSNGMSNTNTYEHSYNSRTLSGGDRVTTFAVEGTPINFSTATSLSDLTLESIEGAKLSYQNDIVNKSTSDNASMDVTVNRTVLENKLDDSVFLMDVAAGDSPRVYGMEGTPMSFSRSDSLSSLGCIDDDDDGLKHCQINTESIPGKVRVKGRPAIRRTSKLPTACKSNIPMSNVMRTELPTSLLNLCQREVVGQSSEESSQADTSGTAHEQDQVKQYEVEGTPCCFSRNSSLSSLHTDDNVTQDNSAETQRQQIKDKKSAFREEGTPVSFSRNSSLSSISIESSPTIPTQYEQDLLEECISSAMPKGKLTKPNKPLTRSLPRGLPRPTQMAALPNKDMTERLPPKSPLHIKAEFDADFVTPTTGSQVEGVSDNVFSEPDSPYMNSSFQQNFDRVTSWRKQPHKSCDEIFTSSPMDGHRFGWRRSHSQDSENFLKQRKDFSNFEKAHNASEPENDDGRHVNRFHQRPFLNTLEAFQTGNPSMPDNRMLEETSTKKVKSDDMPHTESNNSLEKVDSEKSEKEAIVASQEGSVFDEPRSTAEEISIEDIMKETFPDEITLNTDDDLLGSVEDQLGDDAETESSETTFENDGSGDTSCLNETVIHRPAIECGMEKHVAETVDHFQGEEISPEDERELEANANIIVSELFIERELSSSTLDEDFIENETISLVSNGYISDSASEVSISWSTSSKTNSEQTSEYAASNASQKENRLSTGKGPRILKPSDKSPPEQVVENDDNPKGVRGRRKPLHPGSRASSAASTKSTSAKSDPNSRSSKPSDQAVFKTPANKSPPGASVKKILPKGQSQATPVNKVSPKSRLTKPVPASPKSTMTNNVRNTPGKTSGSQSRLPMANGEKTSYSPAGKNKAKISPTERPKPPIKQGTFVMESSSTNGPTITQVKTKIDMNANKMSPENTSRIPCVKKTKPTMGTPPEVKLREKKLSSGSTPSDSQRNSGGSSSGSQRNSDGSPPETWSKALGGYNFLVDTSQEKGYHAPYEQIQMHRNCSDCPEVLKRNNSNNSITKTTTTTITVKISGSSPSNISRIATSNLRKTTSMSPSRCGSGSSLNRTRSAGNLKKTNGKAELKKSDSNLSLKKGSNNSRPPTPSGRRTPTSLNFNNKGQSSPNGTPTKRRNSATNSVNQGNGCVRKTAPGTVGKKQITSKIASLWKKDDGSNSSISSNEKSPPSESKMPPPKSTKPTAKAGANKPALPVKPKMSPPKPVRVDSLPANPQPPREGLSRSSTYDKISACADGPSAGEPESTTMGKINSGTWRKVQSVSDDIPMTSTDIWHGSDSSFDTSPPPVDESDVAVRDKRVQIPQINSGTWTKDKTGAKEDSSSLPDADETFGGTVWRRYDSSEQEDSDDPDVWVKRDSNKANHTNPAEVSYQSEANVNASVTNVSLSNMSGTSIMNASNSSMMDMSNASMMNASTASTSSGIRRLTRSFASSSLRTASLNNTLPMSVISSPNDRGVRVRPIGQVSGLAENKTLRKIAPPFALSASPTQLDTSKTVLESRIGTMAAAIVAPFNYNPTPNATTTATTNVNPLVKETDEKSDPNSTKKSAMVSPTKHMTKTEMLLARRRSYLNNHVKNENGEGEEKKRTCLVTTV